MSGFPTDWPGPGPLDLAVHDLPHASSATEWWYVNTHVTTVDGRQLSLFASFFRIVKGRDEATGEPQYAHSLSWAMTDPARKAYWGETLVDRDAPRLGLDKLERGEGSQDQRLRRAMREVLLKGKVPWPDRLFTADPFVATRRLELEFEGNTFVKRDDGAYALTLRHPHYHCGAELVFTPRKPAVRHGEDGVVKGTSGEDMFYYFIPRCEVTGQVTVDGLPIPVAQGEGWYDHEFGGHRPHGDGQGEDAKLPDVAWNWLAVQLADGRELSGYQLVDVGEGRSLGQKVLLIDREGRREAYDDFTLEPERLWRSTRTFNDYPVAWRLTVPGAGVALTLTADVDDQEMITVISKPAFWEGRITATGRVGDAEVTALGYLERSGYQTVDGLDDFFKAVSVEVRKSVAALVPMDPSWEQVRDMIASEERAHYMQGVDLEQVKRTAVEPVRAITDRGGKSWRSYAALACCDIVGGDSRKYVQWLAMPELMHVGSLIVDDVQDRSTVRRGGPSCHMIYGDALAINAGTACYFMGQKLLKGSDVSDRAKLRLYDLYFEALRAGHAGQAFDLEGLGAEMPAVIDTGDGDRLEERVLCVHRLKTAAPAGALSRMGAVAGDGTEAQIEGLGRYFESVGLAFQIIDDVLNLRGFKGDLKAKGEDISHGKITMPVAKAMSRLERADRAWMWETVASKPQDPAVVGQVIAKLEACGALDACVEQANTLVEDAWRALDPLVEDSLPKLMLRAFGWYVLERHY